MTTVKLTIAAIIATVALSTAAWAACRSHTYTDGNGRMTTCTTCCTGSYCNTTCI